MPVTMKITAMGSNATKSGRQLSVFQKNLLPPPSPTLKIKSEGSFKTAVNFYETTRSDSPEDRNLHDKQHSPGISFPDEVCGIDFCSELMEMITRLRFYKYYKTFS
jgi:hypothetical protein